MYNAMIILKKDTWLLLLLVCLLFSCNKEDTNIEEPTNISVNAKEVLIEIVDTCNHHLAKDKCASFHIIAENEDRIESLVIENNGKTYLKFIPLLSEKTKGEDIVTKNYKVYKGSKMVAKVKSEFQLDSVRSTGFQKIFYYTNSANKVNNQPMDAPAKILIGANGAYREYGASKFCVVFNFLSVKAQSTEVVDYHVTIRGFMGQNIVPIQKGLIAAENPDGTQKIVLAVEGIIHNYYNTDGVLYEPWDINYEIVSRQLFKDNERHTLKVTNLGDCYSYKIQSCSFDGQYLNLASIVRKNSFGGEYIHLTIK